MYQCTPRPDVPIATSSDSEQLKSSRAGTARSEPHHQVQVLPGGSGNLEALPGVGGAAVQQLGAGHAVLARDADLPVAIDHKLGVAVLEGWNQARESEGSGGQQKISPPAAGTGTAGVSVFTSSDSAFHL